MSAHEASPGPSSQSALQRGRACVSCRRRKMRCDGTRPVCGQCSRANRAEDCEYTDGQGRSRTQMLEENIARLEARIHELENPTEPSHGIQLFDPYSQGQQLRGSTNVLPLDPLERRQAYSGSPRGGSPIAGSRSSSQSSHRQPLSASTSPLLSGVPSAAGGSPTDVESLWSMEELPIQVRRQLLDNFASFASEIGFFLNPSRFRNAALLNMPFGHALRPSPAILSTVYLWGVKMSSSDQLVAHEPRFLARALQHTAQTLAGTHPQRVLHAIQAEVLLAQYFFCAGRFLEGRYHASAAVALSLSCGLHKIRSDRQTQPAPGDILASDTGSILPAPQDVVEEGERINAFWAVFTLDTCWSTALQIDAGAPSMLASTQVDTPFPLDIPAYEQCNLPPELRGRSTLDVFLADPAGHEHGDFSVTAALAKAAFLFEKASTHSNSWRPNMQQIDADNFVMTLLSLDTALKSWIGVLPRPAAHAPVLSSARALLVTHTLARAALIQLHRVFADTDPTSAHTSVEAAKAAAALLDDVPIAPADVISRLNPIIGALWMSIAFTLMGEITRLRTYRAAWPPNVLAPGEEECVVALDKVMGYMATVAPVFTITQLYYARVQEAYVTL